MAENKFLYEGFAKINNMLSINGLSNAQSLKSGQASNEIDAAIHSVGSMIKELQVIYIYLLPVH
jgi:hypothetical protein